MAGEMDKPEAIGLSEARFFDLAVEDDKLLPEQGVLGDELSFASGKISGCGKCNRVARRLRDMEEAPFES
jgi:hypothetical protein